jgi:surfeit locus 1 family protein
MASLESLETTHAPSRRAVWRELPRLLISRPWRWITPLVIVLAIGLASLGFWQLDRFGERRAYNALLESRLAAPPLDLTAGPIDVAANEYRRVVVSGTYDHANEVVLRSRSFAGAAGVDVLTPLRIDGTDQAVLVNRGWVPAVDADRRAPFEVEGPVRVEGILRQPQTRRSSLMPVDQQPADGRLDAWFRADVEKIANQIPYPVLPLFVEKLPAQDDAWLPRPHPALATDDYGPHLGYAIQWFSFALILVGGYVALIVTRTEQERGLRRDDPRPPEPPAA